MARSLFSSLQPNSRSFRSLRYRVVIVLCILGTLQQQSLYYTHRQSLSAKYSPTDFVSNSHKLDARFEQPYDEASKYREELIANRASWSTLGEGWEGKVFV